MCMWYRFRGIFNFWRETQHRALKSGAICCIQSTMSIMASSMRRTMWMKLITMIDSDHHQGSSSSVGVRRRKKNAHIKKMFSVHPRLIAYLYCEFSGTGKTSVAGMVWPHLTFKDRFAAQLVFAPNSLTHSHPPCSQQKERVRTAICKGQ